MVKCGNLLALAVSSAVRSPLLPDVPSIVEAGVPGAEFTFWIGLLAPANTPRAVISELNANVQKIVQMPEVKQRMAILGAEAMPMSATDFDALMRREFDSLSRVMRGVKPG
jgi:tripartite-type tricarboxylate transporter receptor subunit TctC